jgi:hypothetical protein
LHLACISSGFATIFFFTKQGRQFFVQPTTLRTTSLYLCPQVTGRPSDKPQAVGSLSVGFYFSHGYSGSILTRLHTGNNKEYRRTIPSNEDKRNPTECL